MRASLGSRQVGLASLMLLVSLACSGCHLIYPFVFESNETGADARTEGGPVPRDALGEVLVSDASGEGGGDLPLCTGDTPPVAQERIACSCAPPQGDCDAIPEAPPGHERDLEPSHCNALLYEETFATDPLSAGRWKALAGAWTHSCGWLHQPATATAPAATSWVQAVAPPLGTTAQEAHYLVEARFKLGALGSQKVWQVGIAARVGAATTAKGLPRDYISCVARIDAQTDWCYGCTPQRNILYPDLKLESYNAKGGYGAWPLANPPGSYTPAAGETYLLQLWYRPLKDKQQVNCRLYDEANVWKRDAIYQMWGQYAAHTAYLPTAPGTVALRTLGRAASFDYVRVFRIKTDAR